MITEFLTPQQAAQYLSISASSLAKRRLTGDTPLFVKLGRSVRYRRSDLEDWAKALRRRSTSDHGSEVA